MPLSGRKRSRAILAILSGILFSRMGSKITPKRVKEKEDFWAFHL
jgi:hypothetical protein